MRIVFFGNTKYSLIDAKALHEHFGLTAIVTIPDRENIHKKTTLSSPTKIFSQEQNIPVIEANKLTPDIAEQIYKLEPDFLVVADYGLILPQKVLDIPKFAPLNIHHSLLPKYRGPSPAPEAILNGDRISGVSVIKMNAKVDDGDILAKRKYELQRDETTDSLLTKLNQLGAQAVIEVIENYNKIKQVKQDESLATFTQYMNKQDGYIDVENPPSAEKLSRMIRAYYPWPGVWSKLRIKHKKVRIKLLPTLPLIPSQEGKRKMDSHSREGVRGRVFSGNDVFIQVEGKKPQTIKDFLNGYPEAKQWLEKLLMKQ